MLAFNIPIYAQTEVKCSNNPGVWTIEVVLYIFIKHPLSRMKLIQNLTVMRSDNYSLHFNPQHFSANSSERKTIQQTILHTSSFKTYSHVQVVLYSK